MSDLSRTRVRHEAASNGQLWQTYLADRSLTHRNELIVAYQSLVTDSVRRLPTYITAYWGRDELASFGQDGLVRAIERWSDHDTAKFEAYARRCIRGGVFDELRRLDWMPRTTRKRIIQYKQTFDSLVHELGRNPRPDEVCGAMGLTRRQATELVGELNASQLLHLSAPVHGTQEVPLADSIHALDGMPESEALFAADLEALRDAMSRLAAREQTVLLMAFVGEMTQEQIGEIIGVGGPQVCKIQSAAIKKLRAILGPAQRLEPLASAG